MTQKRGVIARIMICALLICGWSWATSAERRGEWSQNWSPGSHTLSIAVDGLERRFVVHVPESYETSRQWPVVIMFHGGGGRAKVAMWQTGWPKKADQEGFLVVFPEGTPPDMSRPGRFIGNPQTWNDGSKRGIGAVERKVADVKFVSMMIEYLKGHFSVDERRVYITGFSNGASMSFRLVRELSSVFAAVAPVAGADWLDGKQPDRAVPLLYITGTADPLNPFEGGEIRIGPKRYGNKPPIDKMILKWVKLHGSQDEPHTVYDQDGAKGVSYSLQGDVHAVVLYTLEGHGHHWPGGKSALPEKIAGKNTAKLNATDVIWEFFKRHSLPVATRSTDQQDAPADADKTLR